MRAACGPQADRLFMSEATARVVAVRHLVLHGLLSCRAHSIARNHPRHCQSAPSLLIEATGQLRSHGANFHKIPSMPRIAPQTGLGTASSWLLSQDLGTSRNPPLRTTRSFAWHQASRSVFCQLRLLFTMQQHDGSPSRSTRSPFQVHHHCTLSLQQDRGRFTK